jgi:hypothetical protein
MCGGLYILKMTRARHRKCVTVLLISVFLFFVAVVNVNGAETRHHDAHVHGVGKLNVVLDGSNLVIELKSPAVNIVGFEHAPEDEQQSHEVHEAIELLKEGEKLFVLTTAAQCTLLETHVDNDMKQGHHEEHEAHDHEDAHSGEDHGDDSTHSEFEATYHFECVKPDSLKSIDVLLFSEFSGFEELEVQLLTPKRQTADELTPKKFQISL